VEFYRVCAYARVSTKAEKQESSLTSQITYYNNLINSNPQYINMGVYAERKSGANQKKRSQFLAMIQECKNRNIDIIYTKTVARFGRNASQLLKTLEELTRIGVRVIFEMEDIDSIRDQKTIKTAIKSYFAEEELVRDSEAVRFGIQRRFEQGQVSIGNPYPLFGYEYDENRVLKLVPEKAKIVKEIFERFCNNERTCDIIRWLNNNNITTSAGRKWNYNNLSYLLRQEKYTGDAYLQKYYRENGSRYINKGEKPMYVVERWCEPIITHEMFEKAKERRERNSKYERPKGYVPKHDIFRGIIKCGMCGASFNKASERIRKTNAGERLDIAYNCQTRKTKGVRACRNHGINRNTLEDAFIKAFNSMRELLGQQQKMKIKNEEITKIDIKIQELLNKEKVYLQMEVRGLMTDEFKEKHEELITQVMKLEDRKKEIYKYNQSVREKCEYVDKFDKIFKEQQEMKEFNEEICGFMVEQITIVNRNKLLYKFRNGYIADVEVIDYYLERDEIGDVNFYVSTKC